MNIPTFNYPSSVHPLYAVTASACKNDLTDRLISRLAHLESMLATTYGDSGEAFRCLNDDLQDNYMWACSDMASECRELMNQICARG